MKRLKITVKGSVQGVSFRRNTKLVADKLGLTGYVKNLPDSSVEVVAEGTDDKLKELLAFCRKGPEGAYVSDVEVEYKNATNEFTGFDIRY